MAASVETFPCCRHCQFPGCPEWKKFHYVRCWKCLKDLCTEYRDDDRPMFVPEAMGELREMIIETEGHAAIVG